jgi:hypothetical protein
MSLRKKPTVALYFYVLIGAYAAPALADDSCAGFKWDVSRERALFGSSAQAATHREKSWYSTSMTNGACCCN